MTVQKFGATLYHWPQYIIYQRFVYGVEIMCRVNQRNIARKPIRAQLSAPITGLTRCVKCAKTKFITVAYYSSRTRSTDIQEEGGTDTTQYKLVYVAGCLIYFRRDFTILKVNMDLLCRLRHAKRA